MDCKTDKRMLNSNAIQKLLTENPLINLSASRIIHALITSKNNPNVKIVIGKVSITKMGFRMAFKKAKTAATIMAIVKLST